MTTHIDINREEEAGFTLVELAVVMIIIGLLIGGILKGQELITNAEISNSVQTIETVDSATLSFRDAYGDLAGDMPQPAARIPQCAGVCTAAAGDGNREVDTAAEADGFFSQLYLADFIGGLDDADAAASAVGDTFPELAVGNAVGLDILQYHPGNAIIAGGLGAVDVYRRGHYFTIPAASLENRTAASIDRKLDDGSPTEGDVTGNAVACNAGAPAGFYDEQNTAAAGCGLFIRSSF